jgi:hypothetical protein
MGGGSQSIFNLRDDVPDTIVGGGKDPSFGISGLNIPAEVVVLGVSCLCWGSSLYVGGGAGDLVA